MVFDLDCNQRSLDIPKILIQKDHCQHNQPENKLQNITMRPNIVCYLQITVCLTTHAEQLTTINYNLSMMQMCYKNHILLIVSRLCDSILFV